VHIQGRGYLIREEEFLNQGIEIGFDLEGAIRKQFKEPERDLKVFKRRVIGFCSFF
jgi:hypothetical protein